MLERDVINLNLNEKETLSGINNRFANYIEKGLSFSNCDILLDGKKINLIIERITISIFSPESIPVCKLY